MDIHRIGIALNEVWLVNLVYIETDLINSEVLGSFSGKGGGGYFHKQVDGVLVVSTDPLEFEVALTNQILQQTVGYLDRARSEFELNDDQGNVVEISQKGLKFLAPHRSEHGYVEAFSEDASEDFIYDLQNHWNLSFWKG